MIRQFYDIDNLRVGEEIKVSKAYSHVRSSIPSNLIQSFGMDGDKGKEGLHDNHKLGSTMWSVREENPNNEVWVKFDLGNIYPVADMYIWNYNQFDPEKPDVQFVKRGLKNIKIFYSVDENKWIELKGDGYPYTLAMADGSDALKATNLVDGNAPISFDNKHARYIKITANAVPGDGNWGGADGNEPVFGLSEVKFFVGEGFYSEDADEWTNMFERYSGWTGADASFSIPYSGYEAPGNAAQTHTLFTFGDTWVGAVDPKTLRRYGRQEMLNNTMAILEGGEPDPDKMKFIWGENGCYDYKAVIIPEGEDKEKGYYYWLQDGIIINGQLTVFGLLTREDPEGGEGFKFSTDDVDMITMPMGPNGPMFDKKKIIKTPLHVPAGENRGSIFMSCSFMSNTAESGSPNSDGYVYLYGTLSVPFNVQLIASRFKPEDIHNFDRYEYWDGEKWGSDITKCAPLASGLSHEFSVSPIHHGLYKGKYIVVYQEMGNGWHTAYRIGDSPVGPFSDPVQIYHTRVPEEGQQRYVYNAKAHPHLSKPGQLLVSYNTNTASDKGHFDNGLAYRTRWLCIKDTTV